jgi:hypothetical protein
MVRMYAFTSISRQAATGAALVFVVASSARGQCAPGGPPNPSWEKRTISGIVMDSSHRFLEGADVVIRSPRRQAKTDRFGRFQLAELDTGVYDLTVRRIGYEIAVQSYRVTDSGSVARFCLNPDPRGLPAMITSATRPGLSGMVGDSSYAPLAGAEVRAVAEGQRTLTDSTGSFYLPLRKGTYPILITKAGFGRQFVSVTVPEDSGRQIAVWLGSPERNARRLAVAYDSLRLRLMRAVSNRSSLLSSEDLSKTSADLTMTAQAAARWRVRDDCEAKIDGGPFTLPMYMIDKEDVSLMEVYAPKPPRLVVGSINPQGTGGSGGSGGSASNGGVPSIPCPNLYIWMKP